MQTIHQHSPDDLKKSVSVIANDSTALFFNLLYRFQNMGLSVSLWGSIPKEKLEDISEFINNKGAINRIRRVLFQEYQLDIEPDQYEHFISACQSVDFNTLSWGIYKEDEVFAFSRASDDINLTSNKFVSLEQLKLILEELQGNHIVKEYEVLD